jgi:hypothetical protein
MATNKNSFSKDKKRRDALRRHSNKTDSILRLTFALNRDIDKMIGNAVESYETDTKLDLSLKLDLISGKLLEMRDKLEKHCNSNTSNANLQLNTNNVYSNNNCTQNTNYTYPENYSTRIPQTNDYFISNTYSMPYITNQYPINYNQYFN